MKKISATTRVAAAAGLVALAVAAATTSVPTARAAAPTVAPAAAVPTAMEACLAGEAPDAEQTVFMSGTSGRAFYPRGVNPDNAIFPGDVVTVEVTGRLRYNATRWTGPAGTGTPDAYGIRPYAATAMWNNLPAGRVGNPMPAVGLQKCTAAPKTAGVRMLYGIKDKDLTDNAGGYTITTRVWKAPGRITIDRTEVTQGVQNRSGQVALIAGKRTFVRVFFHHEHDGATTMPGVTGSLRVPGLDGSTPPRVNSEVTSLTAGDDPRTLENSLLFEVPAAALTEGSRQLVVTVKPPSDRGGGWPIVRHVPVTFGPTTSLKAIGVRYSYSNVPQAMTNALRSSQPGLAVEAGSWRARTLASWEPLRRMAENVLPLARLTIKDDAAGTDHVAWGSATFDCEAAQRPSDGLWYCGGWEDAIAWSKKYADELCPGGGCLVILLQPEIDLTGATGYCACTSYGQQTAGGNDVINIQEARAEIEQGNTLAHELGHYYRLPHTWEDPHFGTRNDLATIGSVIGLRTTPRIQLVPERPVTGGTTYDLMTYQRSLWLSVYNYCKAMHAIPGPNPVCSPGWNQ